MWGIEKNKTAKNCHGKVATKRKDSNLLPSSPKPKNLDLDSSASFVDNTRSI